VRLKKPARQTDVSIIFCAILLQLTPFKKFLREQLQHHTKF